MTSQRIFKHQFGISEQSSIRFRGQIHGPSGAVRFADTLLQPAIRGPLTSEDQLKSFRLEKISKKDTYCSYIIQTSPHHNINFTFDDDFFVPCHKSGGVYQSGDYVEVRDPPTSPSSSLGQTPGPGPDPTGGGSMLRFSNMERKAIFGSLTLPMKNI